MSTAARASATAPSARSSSKPKSHVRALEKAEHSFDRFVSYRVVDVACARDSGTDFSLMLCRPTARFAATLNARSGPKFHGARRLPLGRRAFSLTPCVKLDK